jgi:hypothetical protein
MGGGSSAEVKGDSSATSPKSDHPSSGFASPVKGAAGGAAVASGNNASCEPMVDEVASSGGSSPQKGVQKLASGDVYEGEVDSAGLKHGRGVMKFQSGGTYDGEWLKVLLTGYL